MARKPADQSVHREDIILAAAEVLQRNGYEAATMKDIAAAVNLTAASLYHHFRNKDTLLLAVLEVGLDVVIGQIESIAASTQPSDQKLRAMIRAHVVGLTENTAVGAAMVFEIRALMNVKAPPKTASLEDKAAYATFIERRDTFFKQRDRFEELFRTVVSEGIARGAFRPLDVPIFVKTLLGAHNWVGVWYKSDGRLNGTQIADAIADTMLKGVLIRIIWECKTMNFDADFGRQYEKVSIRSIPGYELLFQLANDFLQANLPASAELLIVGAGGGKELVTFGSANPGWNFVGVDPAAQMVAFARYKTEQSGLQERVQLIQGIAKDAPTDPLFDAATCLLVFPFVHGDEAKLATLKEISARLKPGAPLIIATVVGDGWNDEHFKMWRSFQIDSGSNSAEVAGVEANVRASVQPVPETRLLELMSEAGFSGAIPFYRAIWFAGWFAWKQSE